METKVRKLANEMCSVWCQADALYSRWAAKNDINYFVLLVLWVLHNHSEGMTQKKISQYYGWPKQTTNSVIRSLKQEDLIILIPEDTMESINNRFGFSTVKYASVLENSKIPKNEKKELF